MELVFSKKFQAEGPHLYQKYAFLQVFSKVFAKICSYFCYFYFPEKLLVTAAKRCKVLKIFISKKLSVYIQGRRLRLALRMEVYLYWNGEIYLLFQT